jgi:DNA polymerase (family 10)
MISNIEMAALFEELADLMELAGEGHFKISAYRNAVKTIDSLQRPLKDLSPDEIAGLSGVGKAISGKIGSALETGTFPTLEKWRQSVWEPFRPISRLDGMSIRKLRVVIRELNIITIDDLKKAVDSSAFEAYTGLESALKRNIKEYLLVNHG